MDAKNLIAEKIIAMLEKGEIPWKKPWFGTKNGAYSRITGRPYSFLNQILLGKPGEYLTFKQIKELGGRVKKGEKAHQVVFWTFIEEKKDASATDSDGKPKKIPYLKTYNVFHIDQTEGIEQKYVLPTTDTVTDDALQSICEAYFEREHIAFESKEGGNQAYYSPSRDLIVCPAVNQFKSQEGYYGTLFHEMVHSTGAKNRLEREGIMSLNGFGSEKYSREELVAELGSATLLHQLGRGTEGCIENSAAYIQSWLEVLKNDKNAVIVAAGAAEKAVKFILNEEGGEVVNG